MFDRSAVKSIKNQMQDSLDVLAKHLNCQIKVEAASFAASGSNCTFKVELAKLSGDGCAETKEVMDFRRLAPSYGLMVSDLGKKFYSNGMWYTICGLKPRASKYPILASRPDGKRFKFSPESVKFLFQHQM